mmetsp:Transcript_16251/g.32932  ORF Transcript_16251/g.32932 Transcript_16251/m.32932 type:complete len:150 (-) Transcript_16251:502-951(-)
MEQKGLRETHTHAGTHAQMQSMYTCSPSWTSFTHIQCRARERKRDGERGRGAGRGREEREQKRGGESPPTKQTDNRSNEKKTGERETAPIPLKKKQTEALSPSSSASYASCKQAGKLSIFLSVGKQQGRSFKGTAKDGAQKREAEKGID